MAVGGTSRFQSRVLSGPQTKAHRATQKSGMKNSWPFHPITYVSAAILLVTLLLILAVSHAKAEGNQEACYDELVIRWNEFASDANNHVQTSDAKRTDHEKAHERLDREWNAIHSLAACW